MKDLNAHLQGEELFARHHTGKFVGSARSS